MHHLYLTGYRGCGKSTIAERLSRVLDLPWCDTDAMVESSARMTIAEIFSSAGENVFRDLESDAIRSLSTLDHPQIVALGGGAILRAENRQLLKSSGWVAWLQASPETLVSRIAMDKSTAARRPALSQLGVLGEIQSVLEKRWPLYEEAADEAFDTESTDMESLANKIAEAYRKSCS
ncbi:shikimate kinase [Pirellulaceae bacterium SH501]